MEIKTIYCLKCNTDLKDTKLKRYCRGCITTIKNDREDTEDINKQKCNKCRCYKDTDEFKNILKNCKGCRTRKEHRDTNDNNNGVKDGLAEENKHIKKSITKVKYKVKLENILTYLKDKYKITETIKQLEDMDNNLLEESDLETGTTTDIED
jgi:hypothetical protein